MKRNRGIKDWNHIPANDLIGAADQHIEAMIIALNGPIRPVPTSKEEIEHRRSTGRWVIDNTKFIYGAF